MSGALGLLDQKGLAHVRAAAWIGLPPFQVPSFSPSAILVIAPVFVVLVAENKGHLAAIGAYMGRDLTPQLGRAYLGDAVATFVSALGGGTPQTTYAENMGVMALTQVFSCWNFAMAAAIATALGMSPKFGAVVQTIPPPVLAGATLVLYGLIAMMGVRIWIDEKVDFSDERNLLIAGTSVIAATGLGINGVTVGGVNVAGIAFGTVLAVVLRVAFGRNPRRQSSRVRRD
jgi:xanthine/uracil permease